MKELELQIWPEPILKKTVDPVFDFDPVELNKTVIQMYDMMSRMEGAGLSGPQVGLNARIITFQDFENGKSEAYMINPVILAKEGEIEEWEGCLSFPGVSVKVKRAEKVKVEYQTSDGEVHTTEYDGFTARILQHEIEHLDGIVFTRYLSSLKRDVVNRKMKKVRDRVKARRAQMGS